MALERCRTAREAVELMGALIDEYGLWGSGETLAVADREEAWVFEMQMSPTGKGGFWIAEKIPDGDFFIETSQFLFEDWKELFGQLLKKFNAAAGVKYERRPESNTPKEY